MENQRPLDLLYDFVFLYIESSVGYEDDPVIEENLKCRQVGKSTNALTTTKPLAFNTHKDTTMKTIASLL